MQSDLDLFQNSSGSSEITSPASRSSVPTDDRWAPHPADESSRTSSPEQSPYVDASPQTVLNDVFGYQDFRQNQKTIIDALVGGKDVFALMPTGSGKSLCFQIPSMIRKGVGIVVSPLIALMQDQVEDLRQNGVRAHYLNSSLSFEEADRVSTIAEAGDCDLLYVAPERLLTSSFQRLLDRLDIALFAIDEAHCVSQWGHDFRPEYLNIAEVTQRFPDVPRIGLTATADLATRKEIVNKLHLTDAHQVVASFDRPNIFYRVQIKKKDRQQLLTVLRERHAGESGIVYVRTRKRVDSISDWLKAQGIAALPYHAGLDAEVRQKNQQRFLMEDGIVMVATVAFGMGIDKPDIRVVVHLDLPASMESYYQETGRAGRDSQPAEAWMFYSTSDVVAMRQLQDYSDGSDAFKSVQQKKLNAFLGFCESPECRRKGLLEYFGETFPAPCDGCDNCTEPVDTWDGTVAAQKALSCVYRTGQRFGATYLIDVLTGNADERMQRFGHDKIKTFGIGDDLDIHQWHSVFRQLLAAGYLTSDLASKRGFRLTEKSRSVLTDGKSVFFRKDAQSIKGTSGKKSRSTCNQSKRSIEYELDSADARTMQLWEALRELRLELSKELSIPPYVIFHDKTLKEMIARRPARRNDLLAISGIGQNKLERFGDQFFEVLERFK